LPIVADLTIYSKRKGENPRNSLAKLIGHLQGSAIRQRPKVVLVLSPKPSETRPYFILELMDVAVDSRLMTMVVDGDPSERRLSASAPQNGPLNFADVVKQYGHQRLGTELTTRSAQQWMLPMAQSSGVTLSAYDGNSIGRAIRRVGQDNDFVFIDGGVPQSPQSLPALMDAADHIIILAEPRKTRRPEMMDLMRTLNHNIAKCAGIVVHDEHFSA